MPDEENKPWMIRDVSEEVRRDVKMYAVQHSVTVAEALEALVRRAVNTQTELLAPPQGQDAQEQVQSLVQGLERNPHGYQYARKFADSFLTEEDVLLVIDMLVELAMRIHQRILDNLNRLDE